MDNLNNSAKIYTGSSGGELRISLNNTKKTISATNNRAQYYAELAEKYKDEAKEHRDNAQYYAEQNSDVTFSYIDSVKHSLEEKIETKQDVGNYALKSEIPTKVSELDNDSEYTTFDAVIPEQTGNSKKVLTTDGDNLYWGTNSSYSLFDEKTFDYILNFEESKGWALLGSYVYKNALAGSWYGYVDFYNKCIEEKEASVATEIAFDESTITVYVNSNGHKFYDIKDRAVVDAWYEKYGEAWLYGIDIDNERVLLPRSNESIHGKLIKSNLNSTKWLRLYSDGWCEQGGYVAYGTTLVQFEEPFSDTSYSLTGSYIKNSSLKGESAPITLYKTSCENFTIYPTSANSDGGTEWRASGYINFSSDKSLNMYLCVGNTEVSTSGAVSIVNQAVDILSQVNQGIESRVDLDASNLTEKGKQFLTSFSFPSYKYIDLTLGASGSTYLSPADGWYYIEGNDSNKYVNFSFQKDGVITRADRIAGNSYSAPVGLVATCEGEIVTVTYTIPNASKFRFIYAQGSESKEE